MPKHNLLSGLESDGNPKKVTGVSKYISKSYDKIYIINDDLNRVRIKFSFSHELILGKLLHRNISTSE